MAYRSHSFRFKADVKHRSYDDIEKSSLIQGIIVDIIDCPGHTAPLALVKFENGEKNFILAPEETYINYQITSGFNAPANIGNTLPLKNIPIGAQIHNIESKPGDGGKFIRSSGTFAKVISKDSDKVIVLFPSNKYKTLDQKCRATMGIVAGGGRTEKPFVKAGKEYYAMKARGRLYPRTSGVSMNAGNHPFGSGRGSHKGKPTTVSRNAPPGRKVGQIGAKRTGWKR